MHSENIFFIVGLFYLVSFLALYRYYRILKTSEYLLASFIFLALFANGIIIDFFGGIGTIYEQIPVLLAIFLLLIVTKNVLSTTYDAFYYTILTMMISLSILNLFTFLFVAPIFHLIQFIEFEIMRFLVGFYLVYSYKNIKVLIENRRTKTVQYSWIVCGIIAMGTSFFRICSIIIYLYKTPADQLSVYPAVLDLPILLVSLGALILSVITGIIAIFYPEVFIMSRQQINQLDQLYELTDRINSDHHMLSSFFADNSLIDYLETVAEEMDRMVDQEVKEDNGTSETNNKSS